MLTFNLLGLGAACLAFQFSTALPSLYADETHNLRYMLTGKPKAPAVAAPELLANETRPLNGTAEGRTSNMTVIIEEILKNASTPFANGTHTVNETTPEMRTADGSFAVHGPQGVSEMLQEMAAHKAQAIDDARAMHDSWASNVTQSANQTLTIAAINRTQSANETLTIAAINGTQTAKGTVTILDFNTTDGKNGSDDGTKYLRRTGRANFEHR